MHLKPKITSIIQLCATGLIVSLGLAIPSFAQVVPDGTLNTTVSPIGNNFTINNGTQVGSNLFHSFSQFSVPTGGSAFFNNITTIQNIFARVTGGNVSNIDGLIRANGSANLFLMNPAGILFGPNARLNIGGSFVASTANSIHFADGVQFSAINPQATPLLTVSVPIGLQMGSNPGPITVQGTGHNAQFDASSRVSGLPTGTQGLQVATGKTLALVGGNLALNGGLLLAPGGRIELGSVTSGSVAIASTAQGFALSYPNASSFGNIQMVRQALASVRGTRPGSIQIQGNQVNIRDGSLVLVQNQGSQTAGDIVVNATDSLQITGKSPGFRSSSSLINETTSSGAAGNILITTPHLIIDQGGFVLDRTFSAAPGGNIGVNTGTMQVSGFAPGDTNAFRAVSQLVAGSFATGKGGDVSISTQHLLIAAGGNVATRPFASGNGGDMTVKADTILVTNAGAPTGNYFSLLSAATFGTGDAGNLNVSTRTLSVQAGGRVSASSIVLGNAGSLTINASESIEVSGATDEFNPSYIGTAVRSVLSQTAKINAGDTTLSTPLLKIRDGGKVFVENLAAGEAGTLTVNAHTLKLDNGGSISASTRSGSGGNINLQLRDLLLMRHGSFISATAGGAGNGGNITINAPIIAGFENSDIIANAVKGRGGNIQITTQGLFGLKFRSQLTPKSDITASSQFGVSGNVQINELTLDPTSGLEALPVKLADPTHQIATGCAGNSASRFVATGRGGVPQNPLQQVQQDRIWEDVRDLSAYRHQGINTVQTPAPQPPAPVIIEASTWHQTADGVVELVAQQTPAALSPIVNCSGNLTTMVDSDTRRE